MLSLGFPTTYPFAPLGGLGDYTETPTSSGSCAGADFRCSARPEDGGIFSCRPCTTAVLEVFKGIQNQINRLIVIKKLQRSLIDVDGRIGPKTVSAFKAVTTTSPGAVKIPSTTEDAARWIAVNAEEVQKELKLSADSLKAPPVVSQPVLPVPVTQTQPGVEPSMPVPAAKKKSKAGIIVGSLAFITAAGLIGAAAYAKKKG